MNDHGELLVEVYRRDFFAFASRAFYALFHKKLKPNWHLQAIAQALNTIGPGGTQCIFLPPRALKSFLVSIAWVAWKLGQDPRLNFLCASYGADLARDHARTCLQLMSTPFYKGVFPGTHIVGRGAVDHFKTTLGGGRLATSVGGVGTGFGGDFTIIDDPIKADEANYEQAIDRTLEWYKTTIASRGDDKVAGAQILVMQRLHENDLGGYLTGLGWPDLCLPAINDEERMIPIGKNVFHRWSAGALLHPEREPQHVLDHLRTVLGSRRFSGQYLQKPLPASGNLILRKWLMTYTALPESLDGGQVIQCWDVAASLSSTADFSACVTVRKIGNRFCILDVFRDRLPFDKLREKIIESSRRWRPSAVLIENTSSGIGMIQELQSRSVPGLASVVKINPGIQSKYERVEAQTAIFAAGDVFLPTDAPWLEMFMYELLGFPNTIKDDMVDALAHLLSWAKKLSPPPLNEGPELVFADGPECQWDYPDYNQPCSAWLAEHPEYGGGDDGWG